MTNEKLLEVIEKYEALFEGMGLSKDEFPHDETLSEYSIAGRDRLALCHCYSMLDEMKIFIQEGHADPTKVHRWLGFIQGVLFTSGPLSLNEMKDHNRPDGSSDDQKQEDPQDMLVLTLEDIRKFQEKGQSPPPITR